MRPKERKQTWVWLVGEHSVWTSGCLAGCEVAVARAKRVFCSNFMGPGIYWGWYLKHSSLALSGKKGDMLKQLKVAQASGCVSKVPKGH